MVDTRNQLYLHPPCRFGARSPSQRPRNPRTPIPGSVSVGHDLHGRRRRHYGRRRRPLYAYRFAFSYAIVVDLDLDDAPQGGYATKFNASGGIDIGKGICDLLEVLEIGDLQRPYATAETLAELGVTDVARRLQRSESLVEMMLGVMADWLTVAPA